MNTLPLTQYWSFPIDLSNEQLKETFDTALKRIKEKAIRSKCFLSYQKFEVVMPTFEDMGYYPLRFSKLPPHLENLVHPFIIVRRDSGSIISDINPQYLEPGLIQHSVRHKEGSPYPEFEVHRNLGGVRENIKVELKTFEPSWFDMEFIIQEYYIQCRGVMKK